MQQVGAKALIPRGGGYLFIQRNNGNWDIPGGRLDLGETPRRALRRKLFAETGLHLVMNPLPRLLVAQSIMPNSERQVIRLTYAAQATGNLVISHLEHTGEIACMPLEQAIVELQVDDALRELAAELALNNIVL